MNNDNSPLTEEQKEYIFRQKVFVIMVREKFADKLIEKLEGMKDKADYTDPKWPRETEAEKDGFNSGLDRAIELVKERMGVDK